MIDQNNSSVIFEENVYVNPQFDNEGQPLMVALLLKTGLFKDHKQAGFFLLGMAVLFFLIAAILIKIFLFPSPPPSVDIEDLSFIERSQIDPIFLQAYEENIKQQGN